MDPLRFFIATCPLAIYLLLMGSIHLLRRPFVTTGARDAATVAIGIAGLVAIGPMELFFPEGAAVRFGPFVWLLLLALYGLCVSLVVLLMRPRIVVYNTTMEQLRPILASAVAQMDSKARWTDDSLLIPSLHVHLNLEGNSWFRCVQLAAVGTRQNFEGWRKLEQILRGALQPVRCQPGLIGYSFFLAALVLGLGSMLWMAGNPQTVARVFQEMFWR